MGTVTLKEGATLDVSGQLGADADGNPIGGNSGTVFVRGGQLVMDASTILAITMGAVDGASDGGRYSGLTKSRTHQWFLHHHGDVWIRKRGRCATYRSTGDDGEWRRRS